MKKVVDFLAILVAVVFAICFVAPYCEDALTAIRVPVRASGNGVDMTNEKAAKTPMPSLTAPPKQGGQTEETREQAAQGQEPQRTAAYNIEQVLGQKRENLKRLIKMFSQYSWFTPDNFDVRIEGGECRVRMRGTSLKSDSPRYEDSIRQDRFPRARIANAVEMALPKGIKDPAEARAYTYALILTNQIVCGETADYLVKEKSSDLGDVSSLKSYLAYMDMMYANTSRYNDPTGKIDKRRVQSGQVPLGLEATLDPNNVGFLSFMSVPETGQCDQVGVAISVISTLDCMDVALVKGPASRTYELKPVSDPCYAKATFTGSSEPDEAEWVYFFAKDGKTGKVNLTVPFNAGDFRIGEMEPKKKVVKQAAKQSDPAPTRAEELVPAPVETLVPVVAAEPTCTPAPQSEDPITVSVTPEPAAEEAIPTPKPEVIPEAAEEEKPEPKPSGVPEKTPDLVVKPEEGEPSVIPDGHPEGEPDVTGVPDSPELIPPTVTPTSVSTATPTTTPTPIPTATPTQAPPSEVKDESLRPDNQGNADIGGGDNQDGDGTGPAELNPTVSKSDTEDVEDSQYQPAVNEEPSQVYGEIDQGTGSIVVDETPAETPAITGNLSGDGQYVPTEVLEPGETSDGTATTYDGGTPEEIHGTYEGEVSGGVPTEDFHYTDGNGNPAVIDNANPSDATDGDVPPDESFGLDNGSIGFSMPD